MKFYLIVSEGPCGTEYWGRNYWGGQGWTCDRAHAIEFRVEVQACTSARIVWGTVVEAEATK